MLGKRIEVGFAMVFARLMLIAGFGCACASGVADESPASIGMSTKHAAFSGDWRETENSPNGRDLRVRFNGNEIVLSQAGVQTFPLVGTFKVDPMTSCKEIDICLLGESGVWKGIYSLEGDILRLGLAKDVDGGRPKTLGQDGVTFILRRDKPTAE